MALKYGDRVQETFTTTGTGTISLAGPVTGYQAFSAITADADTCYYAATDGTNWEVGLSTYATSGNTLARTTCLASSNAGSKVNWSAGTKTIWLDLPAAAIATFSAAAAGTFITSSQTWTSPSDVTSDTVFKFTLIGPGGGGAGCATGRVSGSGGAGGACILYKSSLAASTGYVYTQGAVGTAGSSGANSGGAGGNSTFVVGGVTMTANGGGGGVTAADGGLGGTSSNGTINITGGGGGSGTNSNQFTGGASGGNSMFGSGGAGVFTGAGIAGGNYGGGGSGGSSPSAAGAFAGGAGGPGCLLIERISG